MTPWPSDAAYQCGQTTEHWARALRARASRRRRARWAPASDRPRPCRLRGRVVRRLRCPTLARWQGHHPAVLVQLHEAGLRTSPSPGPLQRVWATLRAPPRLAGVILYEWRAWCARAEIERSGVGDVVLVEQVQELSGCENGWLWGGEPCQVGVPGHQLCDVRGACQGDEVVVVRVGCQPRLRWWIVGEERSLV